METVHQSVEDAAQAIAEMEVRGATAIAERAASALREQALSSEAEDPEQFRADLHAAARRLSRTRPTAVSLPNALRYVFAETGGEGVEELRESAVSAVEGFHRRLDRAQADLGRVGASRLADGDTVMTHCHSTDVVSCLETAVDRGTSLSAFVKETRPRRQGLETARDLAELGVETTVIVDGAAHRLLADTDHVFVGADTITATGTVVNKIGTSGLAASARERDVPVTVAAQTLKLDPETLSGGGVDIERRDEREVLEEDTVADLGVAVANPAFDETPRRYVDSIVTERGQVPPGAVPALMRELYGADPGRPWEE